MRCIAVCKPDTLKFIDGKRKYMKMKGRVTIPTDESFVEGTKVIAAKWGADAVRDCDGTRLPTNAKELGKEI